MIVNPTHTDSSMAKDNDNYDETAQVPQYAPPSYDASVSNGSISRGPFVPESANMGQDVKVPAPALPTPTPYAYAGPPPAHAAQMPATVVYNYLNPVTGERVVSLLPPDHPQMVCLQQGGHVTASKFGLLGILTAIFWFPLGIGLCLLDRKVYCKRCGAILDDGLC